jgi:maltose alpha-D-glucosyltransferase/alpha-amylase
MSDYWWRNAIIYGVDVGTFLDSNGDGVGDLAGLTSRLDYLEGLGVTCLWLLPFFPTPDRDNGYDVRDFYGVDPRHGDLGDFVELLREAHARGMRVMIDLVVEHTSDAHPWFQAARRDRSSPYRDFYIWVDEPPENSRYQPIFPGVEESVWSWDEEARQYYFHQFYHFQPSLNHASPRVQEEVKKILGFWLELGVDAVRVDAASHMIEPKGGQHIDRPHEILKEYYRFAARRRGDVAMMGESDVEASRLADFFGDGDELTLLMNFLLNNYLYLALARESAEPLIRGLNLLPNTEFGQWSNFLRNLDEVDLERLTLSEREEVFGVFAPREEMRVYGRGIRRRLAPMLGGDRRRIELAFSLLFTLPGAPLLVYGDEIGMGEDLSLPERQAVRTVMQWTDGRNAGFSAADGEKLVMPAISRGKFAYPKVNVAAQEHDPESLLSWVQRAIRTRKQTPEFGWGKYRVLETRDPAVFAHRCDWGENTVIAVHNLGPKPASATLDLSEDEAEHLVDVLGDRGYQKVRGDEHRVELEGYGYRWLRVGGMRTREAKPNASKQGKKERRTRDG